MSYIHIDIKTAKLDNETDYKGKIPVGANQTSYKPDGYGYQVNLPHIYSYKTKICLTYFINIIYDVSETNIEIKAILLIAVPNGDLTDVYGDVIVNAGKTGYSGKGFRYNYSRESKFKLLEDRPSRVRIVYTSEDVKDNINDLINIEDEA